MKDIKQEILSKVPREVRNGSIPYDTGGRILGQIAISELIQYAIEANNAQWRERIIKMTEPEPESYADINGNYWHEWKGWNEAMEYVRNELLNPKKDE